MEPLNGAWLQQMFMFSCYLGLGKQKGSYLIKKQMSVREKYFINLRDEFKD